MSTRHFHVYVPLQGFRWDGERAEIVTGMRLEKGASLVSPVGFEN